MATYVDGRAEVVFRTATPFDTPRLMSALIAETNAALADPTLHPLFTIARFVVSFLAIHPFQDGNGRLSRALTTLLLLRSGYDYVPYASLERVVEENKVWYYAALRESQLKMREDPARFGAWLLFFLGSLASQKRALDTKLSVERGIIQLSETQERIIAAVRERFWWTGDGPGYRDASQARWQDGALPSRPSCASRTARGTWTEARALLHNRFLPKRRLPHWLIGRTNVIIADVLRRGGRIARRDLATLVKQTRL